METPIDARHSLSTLLLAGAIGLALTVPLTSVPWEAITRLFSEAQVKPSDFVRSVQFAGFPVWVLTCLLVTGLFDRRWVPHVLASTYPFVWTDLREQALVEKLRTDFPVLDSVTIRIRGNIDSTGDRGWTALCVATQLSHAGSPCACISSGALEAIATE